MSDAINKMMVEYSPYQQHIPESVFFNEVLDAINQDRPRDQKLKKAHVIDLWQDTHISVYSEPAPRAKRSKKTRDTRVKSHGSNDGSDAVDGSDHESILSTEDVAETFVFPPINKT